MSRDDDNVVPIVVDASAGGPFQDESFFAGYEIGRLEADLAHARTTGTRPAPRWIREANVRQADLAAMQHNYLLEQARGTNDTPPDMVWVAFS